MADGGAACRWGGDADSFAKNWHGQFVCRNTLGNILYTRELSALLHGTGAAVLEFARVCVPACESVCVCVQLRKRVFDNCAFV